MISSTETPSQSVQSPSQTRRDPFELSPVRLEASRAKGHPMKRGKATFDPKEFLAKVGEGKTISKYRKDQIVFSQGEVADAVFYIQVITRLEKATMIATIHNEPEFSELFMSYLLTRNSRIEEDLIDQLFNSSEKRLARLLLLLANFGKEGRPEPIMGKFSQETLAEMIGTTRSRVSFFMNKFRKLGFIEYNGKLEVHNSLLNVVLHDKPEIKTRDEAIGAE